MRTFIEDEKRIAPESIYRTLRTLHGTLLMLFSNSFWFFNSSSLILFLMMFLDILFALGDSPDVRDVQNDISEVCELWYLQQRDGRENVVPQTITFLLVRALDFESKVSGTWFCEHNIWFCLKQLENVDFFHIRCSKIWRDCGIYTKHFHYLTLQIRSGLIFSFVSLILCCTYQNKISLFLLLFWVDNVLFFFEFSVRTHCVDCC